MDPSNGLIPRLQNLIMSSIIMKMRNVVKEIERDSLHIDSQSQTPASQVLILKLLNTLQSFKFL